MQHINFCFFPSQIVCNFTNTRARLFPRTMTELGDPRNQTLLNQIYGKDVPGTRALGVAHRLAKSRAPVSVRSTGPYDVLGHALSAGREAYVRYRAGQYHQADLPAASIYARQATGTLKRVRGGKGGRRTLDSAFAPSQGSAGAALSGSDQEAPITPPSSPPPPDNYGTDLQAKTEQVMATIDEALAVVAGESSPKPEELRELETRLRLTLDIPPRNHTPPTSDEPELQRQLDLLALPAPPNNLSYTPPPTNSDQELQRQLDLLALPAPPNNLPGTSTRRPDDWELYNRNLLLNMPAPPNTLPTTPSPPPPPPPPPDPNWRNTGEGWSPLITPDSDVDRTRPPSSQTSLGAGSMQLDPRPPSSQTSLGAGPMQLDPRNPTPPLPLGTPGPSSNPLPPPRGHKRTRTDLDNYDFDSRHPAKRRFVEDEDLFSLPDLSTDNMEDMQAMVRALSVALSDRTTSPAQHPPPPDYEETDTAYNTWYRLIHSVPRVRRLLPYAFGLSNDDRQRLAETAEALYGQLDHHGNTPLPTYRPRTTSPVVDRPRTTSPVVDRPRTTSPVVDRPRTTSPVVDRPRTTSPVVDRPRTTSPVVDRPRTTSPVVDRPRTTSPVVDRPRTTSPVVDRPRTTSPVAQNAIGHPDNNPDERAILESMSRRIGLYAQIYGSNEHFPDEYDPEWD